MIDILKYIDNFNLQIPMIPLDKLQRTAVIKYNDLWLQRDRPEKCVVFENCDQLFLNRIAVNLLRHNLSNYDEEMEHLFGNMAMVDGILRLKFRVLERIAQVYPELADECQQQMERAQEEWE